MKPASCAVKPTSRMADVVAQRHIQYRADVVADVAVLDGVAFETDVRLEPGRIGLVRDVAQRTGLRARAVQRALRPGQRLDALDVDEPDFRLQRALGEWLLIEIDRGRGIGNERRRVVGDAAEVDRATARRNRVEGQARNEAREIVDGVQVGLFDLLLADRLDLLRDAEQGFLALARGDDDFLETGLGERSVGA